MELESFDAEYIHRLIVGDFRTLEHFTAYFSELIRLKLRSRLRSPEAQEAILHETFERVFSLLKEGKVQRPERLAALVNSVCNNVLLEHSRAAQKGEISIEGEENQDFPDTLGAGPATMQMVEKMGGILDKLPERDRRLLQLVFLEERDKDDICREFGVDRDYLRVLLHRAKQGFKALYLKETRSSVENLGVHKRD